MYDLRPRIYAACVETKDVQPGMQQEDEKPGEKAAEVRVCSAEKHERRLKGFLQRVQEEGLLLCGVSGRRNDNVL